MNKRVRGKRTFFALLAASLAAGWVAGHAQTDDPRDEAARLKADIVRLKREVQRAGEDIRRTDSLTREESVAAAKNLERWQRDRERREKENQELNARVLQLRSGISAEQGRMQNYLGGVEEIQAREKVLLATLSGLVDSLRTRIENGLPWDIDSRRDRLLSLQRDIQAGSASPEEAFGRLAALLREETRGGDEIALLNRPVTRQNGEVVNAQLIKLGNQAIAYMDDEGKNFGLLEHQSGNGKENGIPKFVWREDLDFDERNAVKLALAVKAGREAPQLIPIKIALAMTLARDSTASKASH